VTLDYKALLLLLNKKDDEDFLLGGKGYGVQCCAFCDAIRVRFYIFTCSLMVTALINTYLNCKLHFSIGFSDYLYQSCQL